MSGYRTCSGTFYLVVSEGRYGGIRARLVSSKGTPRLEAGEVAIRLSLELPGALFAKPQLEAKVVIPADKVTPTTLDALVIENVRQAIEQQTGMQVTVALVEPEKAV